MKLSPRLFAAVAGVVLALTLIPNAEATSINHTFSVTANSGPLNGTTAIGTFSYDSSSIVLGGSNSGSITALNLTWNGITYNQITAPDGGLVFDGTGMLTSASFETASGCCGFGIEQDLDPDSFHFFQSKIA